MSLTRLFFAALLGLALQLSPATAAVGYQHLMIDDPKGGQIEVGVWYPADAKTASTYVGPYPLDVAVDAAPTGGRHPLVVMSHGNGGSFAGHVDTAMALAEAGFIAAALTHTGDNYRDQSRAVDLPNSPRQLKRLLDYMVDDWAHHDAVDAGRIGAFGFSAGGFTVLALAGGEPDLSRFAPHCEAHPAVYDCALVARSPGVMKAIAAAKPVWTHDARIRAVVSAAPAIGFAFGVEGLKSVTAPVSLWRAEFDSVLPDPDYATAVRDTLPRPPEFHLVANADHYDFLPPCNEILKRNAPIICPSRAGFDRAAFHQGFNREVVAFFRRTLTE